MAPDRPGRLVVSLHDVGPPFEDEIRAQVAALANIGIRRLVLKVVPSWHGAYPISSASSLTGYLRDLVSSGCQVVLHGYEHRPRGPWRGSPIRRTRGRVFATDSAEFLTLSAEEAREAVRRGLNEFLAAGLPLPDTFSAPGWLLTDEAEDAIVEAGIRRLIGMFSIQDLRSQRLYWLPSLGYMGGGRLHQLGVAALNRLVEPSMRRAFAVKVYLHPDPSRRRRWMPMIQTLDAMVDQGAWHASTFDDVFQDLVSS